MALSCASARLNAANLGAVDMSVSPSVVQRSGDNFTVAWTGNAAPSAADWLGVWIGGYPNGKYFGFVQGVSGPSGTATSGNKTFTATNFRMGAYTICLYPGSSSTHDDPVLGCAAPVDFALGANEPTHLRLQLTENPDEMAVMFITNSTTSPFVRFWPESGSPADAKTVFGTTTWYNGDDLCIFPTVSDPDQPQWIEPGFIHTVVLRGLSQNVRYTYQAGQNSSAMTLPVSFTARSDAPAPTGTAPASQYPFRYVVYADQDYKQPFCAGCETHAVQRHGGGSEALVGQLVAQEAAAARFAAHIGDLGYARGSAFVWEFFSETNQPFWQTVPVAVSTGNHEMDVSSGQGPAGATWHPSFGNQGDDSGGECGIPTMHRFRGVPSEGSNSVFWYSYNYGPVHFAMLTAEVDLSPESAQYRWLVADLAAVDRAATPWLFVGVHRPMYNNEEDVSDHTFSLGFRGILDDVMLRFSVDVLWAGHYHSYLRTAPVHNGTVRESADGWAGATTHITVGTAGIDFDTPSWYPRAWDRQHYAQVYAYGRVDIINATALQFTLVNSVNGSTLDQHLLLSNHSFAQL